MKRQSILFILLLLQVLFICIGCGSSDKSAAPESPAAAAEEAAAVTEEAAVEEAAAPAETTVTEEAAPAEEAAYDLEEAAPETLEEEIIADQKASNIANVEDAVGVFEGLEDNHTAIFSFDGAETAFYFEDPAVQNVLYEAVLGSTYTLSYHYDDSFGYTIYQITEH